MSCAMRLSIVEVSDRIIARQNRVTPMKRQSTDTTTLSDLSESDVMDESSGTKSNANSGHHQEILKLNVGGKMFHVKRGTLEKRRCGILSELNPSQSWYHAPSGVYYFERSSKYFATVLDFYLTGQVHVNRNFCGKLLEEELSFWGLSDDVIADCCWRRYSDIREELCRNERVRREFLDTCQIRLSRMKGLPPWKERLWVTLEDPSYSFTAKIILFGYLFLVVVSLLNASTTSYLGQEKDMLLDRKMTSTNESSQKAEMWDHKMGRFVSALMFVEVASLCILFTFVVIRALVCPLKCKFWKNPLNIIDIMYLISSGAVCVLFLSVSAVHTEKSSALLFGILHHFTMIIGILRVFRAARHYRGVRELWYAIRASFREVWLLSMFVAIGVIVFGIVFFCAHLRSHEEVENIFVAFWWALITMTTVGYGDVVPTVPAGYLVAAVCALVGLVVISLPIPFIAHNFNLYYGYKSRSCRKLEKSSSKDATVMM